MSDKFHDFAHFQSLINQHQINLLNRSKLASRMFRVTCAVRRQWNSVKNIKIHREHFPYTSSNLSLVRYMFFPARIILDELTKLTFSHLLENSRTYLPSISVKNKLNYVAGSKFDGRQFTAFFWREQCSFSSYEAGYLKRHTFVIIILFFQQKYLLFLPICLIDSLLFVEKNYQLFTSSLLLLSIWNLSLSDAFFERHKWMISTWL